MGREEIVKSSQKAYRQRTQLQVQLQPSSIFKRSPGLSDYDVAVIGIVVIFGVAELMFVCEEGLPRPPESSTDIRLVL